MKWITQTAAWIFMLLFFVSCSSFQPPDFQQAFSGELTVSNGTVAFGGTFSRQLIGCYTFTVNEPKEFAGLVLESQNGQITLSFGDIVVKNETTLLPATSFFGSVTGALDDMARQEDPQPTFSDDAVIVYSGSCDAGNYTIAYDAATKNPANLNIGSGILAEFSSVTVTAGS